VNVATEFTLNFNAEEANVDDLTVRLLTRRLPSTCVLHDELVETDSIQVPEHVKVDENFSRIAAVEDACEQVRTAFGVDSAPPMSTDPAPVILTVSKLVIEDVAVDVKEPATFRHCAENEPETDITVVDVVN
jgi:hypothetical protein